MTKLSGQLKCLISDNFLRKHSVDLGFYYPMRFHKPTYELRGRHAALFTANLPAIDNLSTASRLVHRLDESSTLQAGATALGVSYERRRQKDRRTEGQNTAQFMRV